MKVVLILLVALTAQAYANDILNCFAVSLNKERK